MSGTTTTYNYDGDGKRASQTVGGSTRSYVYDPNKALPDILTDGALRYICGLGLTDAVDGSRNVPVSHPDGLGSVRALTDGSGTLIQTYQTDPFGVPSQTQGSSAQPFQFAGQQRDGNGLLRLRARIHEASGILHANERSVMGVARSNPAKIRDASRTSHQGTSLPR